MTTTTTETDTRTEYVAGLRQLADILDANPDLPLPYNGSSAYSKMSIFTHTRRSLTEWARAIPGRIDKNVDETSDAYGLELHGAIRGLSVVVYGDRKEVCHRVVTGTREVTEEVPDPAALAEVPKVTVTRTVEDVEWQCEPLLAERVSA